MLSGIDASHKPEATKVLTRSLFIEWYSSCS